MEQYGMLDDLYFKAALCTVQLWKQAGMDFPSSSFLYHEKLDQISAYFQRGSFPKVYQTEHIAARDIKQAYQDMLFLLKRIHGKEITAKANPFMNRTFTISELQAHQSTLTYGVEGMRMQVKGIFIPEAVNSVQSVGFACALASALKSSYEKERKMNWKHEKTIPLFLGEIYASLLSEKTKENQDLLLTIQFLQAFDTYAMSTYYEKCKEPCKDAMDAYLKRAVLATRICPQIYGYINALKLKELYKEDAKRVLKQVQYVLTGLTTTEEMLQYFGAHRMEEEDILVQRGKILGLFPKKAS